MRRDVPIPRWQLQAKEVRLLAFNLFRRGPAAAREIYQLANGPWLDHGSATGSSAARNSSKDVARCSQSARCSV
jgi:hypothetical protein